MIYCGISLTPPGIKFDKKFSRAVAQYRLDTCLAIPQEKALSDLGMVLEEVRNRVYKKVTRSRITLAEYAEMRAANPGSETKHANLGYYRTVRERFSVEDFAISFVGDSGVISDKDMKYLFMCGASHNTHRAVDLDILRVMMDLDYPAWAFEIIVSSIDALDEIYSDEIPYEESEEDGECDPDSEEDDEIVNSDEEFTLEDLSAAFDNIGVVKRPDGVALFSIPAGGDVAEQHDAALEIQHYLTPVFADKDYLANWLTNLANKIRAEELNVFDLTHG